MTTQSKHTALPWRINKDMLHQTTSKYIWNENYQICIAQGSDDKKSTANAEFIVRCVNSHDALVEALKEVYASSSDGKFLNISEQAIKLVEKALKKCAQS